MIISFNEFSATDDHDVCIAGAGPIGIALAMACANRGLNVLVLESGMELPSEFYTQLGRGIIRNPKSHTPLEEANYRCLGGTSQVWGGRCVPFDPIDFTTRSWIKNAEWPINYEDIANYYADTALFFGFSTARFSLKNPWASLSGLEFDSLERWTSIINVAWLHRETLRSSSRIKIVLGATIGDLQLSPDLETVTSVTAVSAGKNLNIKSPLYVLACGGVETPRLLLAVQRKHPSLFGGKEGPLGRFYMGHIFGKISNIVLNDPVQAAEFDLFMDDDTYVRRRLTIPAETQKREHLLQISFTAGNPRPSDPAHRNGVLSIIWLVLVSPAGKRFLPEALRKLYVGEGERRYLAHIGNVLRTLIPTAIEAFRIFADRYWSKSRKPPLFLRNASGRYTLHYHSEQTPDAENRLRLSDEMDDFGMPRIDIDFRYSKADALVVLRAHEIVDKNLRASGIGYLEFQDAETERADAILDQARDGMHQIGAARMARDPSRGVVDADCKVHGIDNLFLASTCIFPTSGQANPTFLGVALAFRLADHIVFLRGGGS
jgi:hypothetical protein